VTRPSHAPRWPAAGERFTLFGEVVMVGLLVMIAALPVVTALPALAAGCTHLRRHLRAERVSAAGFARTLRAALPGSWRVTVPALAITVLLGFNLLIARAGLPGAPVVTATTPALLAAGSVVLIRAAAAWRPGSAWRALLGRGARATGSDVRGSALLLGAWLLVGVVTWQLPPLLLPAAGCLVLAAIAIDAHAHRGPPQ